MYKGPENIYYSLGAPPPKKREFLSCNFCPSSFLALPWNIDHFNIKKILMLIKTINFFKWICSAFNKVWRRWLRQWSTCLRISLLVSHYFQSQQTGFKQMIIKYSSLYNNCLIDHFISDQNLPFADMLPGFHTRSPLTEHMVNGDQNLSQLFLGNTKSFFAGVVWNVCWIIPTGASAGAWSYWKHWIWCPKFVQPLC